MKITSILAILTSLILIGCASTPNYDEEFETVDTNSDAYITWQEYKYAHPEAKKSRFLRSDQDNNEKLDIGEWRLGVGSTF